MSLNPRDRLTIVVRMDNTTRFNRYITALQQYISREGHALVPATHNEIVNGDTVALGAWVGYVRQRRKAGLLPDERINALNAIQGWNWGPLKPGPATKTIRNSEIEALRREGKSLAQIADHYNLSRQRIHQIVKRNQTTS